MLESQNASALIHLIKNQRQDYVAAKASAMRYKPEQTAFEAISATRAHVPKPKSHVINNYYSVWSHAYFTIATVLENFDARGKQLGRMQLKHLKPLLNPKVKDKTARFIDFQDRIFELC